MTKTILHATTITLALLSFATLAHEAHARVKPKTKLDFIVILDPGHGGEDTGATREHPRNSDVNIQEKNITLAIAKQARQILQTKGIPVVLTRSSDTFIPLDQRTEIANKAGARAKNAVFVSIHANSNDDPRSSGVETYVFNAATNDASKRLADLENGHRFNQSHGVLDLIMADLTTTANFSDSLNLACQIQNTVTAGLQSNGYSVRNRGIRQALFYVLMQTHMPSILFEPGFLSNSEEVEKLTDPAYQKLLVRNLIQGVLGWKQAQKQRFLAKQTHARNISAVAKPQCLIH